MKRHPWQDHYAIRARRQGYPARSVYKLEEIQRSFRILKKGGKVLDLGCCPGSWLLFASKVVGGKGLVVGVDARPVSMQLPTNVKFVRHDVLAWDKSFLKAVGDQFDTVLSDMAPFTTGNKFVDTCRSVELGEAALRLSARVLKPSGAFVCKVFFGPDFEEFSDELKKSFGRVARVRPKGTRKASREIYVVGLRKNRQQNIQVASGKSKCPGIQSGAL